MRPLFDRRRQEQGFIGGYTIIKDYIREREQRSREMFVPLAHPAGDAQAGFGEDLAQLNLACVQSLSHWMIASNVSGLSHRPSRARKTLLEAR